MLASNVSATAALWLALRRAQGCPLPAPLLPLDRPTTWLAPRVGVSPGCRPYNATCPTFPLHVRLDASGQPFADLLHATHAISSPTMPVSPRLLPCTSPLATNFGACLPTLTLRLSLASPLRPSPAKPSHKLSLPPPLCLSAPLVLVCRETQRTKPSSTARTHFTVQNSLAFLSSSFASRVQLRVPRAFPTFP